MIQSERFLSYYFCQRRPRENTAAKFVGFSRFTFMWSHDRALEEAISSKQRIPSCFCPTSSPDSVTTSSGGATSIHSNYVCRMTQKRTLAHLTREEGILCVANLPPSCFAAIRHTELSVVLCTEYCLCSHQRASHSTEFRSSIDRFRDLRTAVYLLHLRMTWKLKSASANTARVLPYLVQLYRTRVCVLGLCLLR